MKVTFDRNIRIAGIGLVPWTRLGLEQWLPNYAIASLYGWDMPPSPQLPPVHALSDLGPLPRLSKYNTAAMLQTDAFQQLLNSKLPDYDLFTYKAVTPPEALQSRNFLTVDKALTAKYENKAWFREKFGTNLNFPSYSILDRARLVPEQSCYHSLAPEGQTIVIQDEKLSGGKGTFIVGSFEQYMQAVENLKVLSTSSRVVVSSAVAQAKERSIQACVTKSGIITGPLQRQIVANPLLANTDSIYGDKFCGAQIIASDQHDQVHAQAVSVAQIVGTALQADGYRGIFGIDFLLDEKDELFTLEVNPRVTGVTPLLAAMYRGEAGVPFYLLHVLELGNYDYEITDATATFEEDASLLVLHALEQTATQIASMPQSGTYKIETDRLVQVSRNVALHTLGPDECIIEEYFPSEMTVKPGGRLMILKLNHAVLHADTDELDVATRQLLEIVRANVQLTPARNGIA